VENDTADRVETIDEIVSGDQGDRQIFP